MQGNNCFRPSFAFLPLLAVGALMCGTEAPRSSRACAAEGTGAYIQTWSSQRVTQRAYPGADFGSTWQEFTAQVKITKTGSYRVMAGYVKYGAWQKSGILKTPFYTWKDIHGEAGDVIPVNICVSDRPPWNNNQAVAVYPR